MNEDKIVITEKTYITNADDLQPVRKAELNKATILKALTCCAVKRDCGGCPLVGNVHCIQDLLSAALTQLMLEEFQKQVCEGVSKIEVEPICGEGVPNDQT